MAVTVMAIALRVTTMKDKEVTDVQCVRVPIDLTTTITDKMAISLAKAISKGRAATSHVPVIIAKVVISRAKAISKEKAAISHALIIIVKVAISKEKAATTVVHALPATILMQSIA